MEGISSVSQPSDQNNSSNNPEPDINWRARYIEQKTAKASQGSVPPATATNPAKGVDASGAKAKKVHWWRWVGLSLLVIVLGFGIFTYIRVSNFLDNSFNGRSEESLLTQAPPTTKAPLPTATISSDRLTAAAAPAAPTATPAGAPPTAAVIPPTVTPLPPTATPEPN